MEREDEVLGAKGPEELEQHHRQHRPGFGQVDGGVAEATAGADELAGELDLAPEVVGALEGQAAKAERPRLLVVGLGGLGPDLDLVAQTGGGLGNFLGKRRDAAAHRIELMGNEEYGGGGGGGNAHAWRWRVAKATWSGDRGGVLGVGTRAGKRDVPMRSAPR